MKAFDVQVGPDGDLICLVDEKPILMQSMEGISEQGFDFDALEKELQLNGATGAQMMMATELVLDVLCDHT